MAAKEELIKGNREGAEVYHGEAICSKRCKEFLVEFSLPNGLLPVDGLEEMGFNRSTGFFWVKYKKKQEHKYKKIGQTVFYDLYVTAFVEPRRMSKLTGVKARELLMTVTINSFFIEGTNSEKITFTAPLGMTKSYPVSAFQLEDEKTDNTKGKK